MYDANAREATQVAQEVRQDLVRFLSPLLKRLDAQLDRRPVQTMLRTVHAIICLRNLELTGFVGELIIW